MTGTIHLIPHVHWDREWYLTRSGFRARLVPMMDELLELLESDPALRFHLDGQMVILEDYLEIMPGSRGTIEALVRRGQLGIGPWYVLADELHPTGASLRKNLDLGIRLARELGGESPVLYSPDAFGHPAGLPALGAEFGIKWAVVWRGLGLVAGADRDLFRWTAPGGASVVTYHLPAAGYEVGIGLAGAGDGLEAAWKAIREPLVRRSLTPEVAVFVGADHHAPSSSLPRLATRLAAIEPGWTVRFSSLAEFFAAAEHHRPELPVVSGELRDSAGYAWSLQGTHASRSRLKRRHAEAERRLVAVADRLDRAAGGPGRTVLDHAWRLLLQSQFHDTICGCCADGVAEEQAVRLDAVRTVADETARRAMDQLLGHDPDRARRNPGATRPLLALWNPDRNSWDGVVVAETTWFDRDVFVGPPGDREPDEGLGYRAFHLTGPRGEPVPVQILRVEPGLERVDAPRHYPDLDQVDRVWIAAHLGPLEGRSLACYGVADGTLAPPDGLSPVRVTSKGAGNGAAGIAEERGALRILRGGKRATGPLQLETEPDHGDLYTPGIDSAARRTASFGPARSLADGPLLGAVEWPWTVDPAGGGRVAGRVVATVHAGEPAVRLRIEFDNQAVDHRLRLRIPVGASAVDAGQMHGAVRRGPGGGPDSWPDERALATAPATGFVAVAGADEPLRIEIPGTFEYELTGDGHLCLTLLRAVGELSRADGPARRGHAGWPMPTPAAQEQGRHCWDVVIRLEAQGRIDPVTRWLRQAAR